MHMPTYAGLLSVNVTLLWFNVTNHVQIFFVTSSLVLVSTSTSLFCCLQFLHRFYFLSFPLSYHAQNFSLTCSTFFHLFHHFFSASILFWVLNLTNRFSHCDWLNYNTQFFFSFSPTVKKVLITKHILLFIEKIRQ